MSANCYIVILRNGERFKINQFEFDAIREALAKSEGNIIEAYFATWTDFVLRLADISAIISSENVL